MAIVTVSTNSHSFGFGPSWCRQAGVLATQCDPIPRPQSSISLNCSLCPLYPYLHSATSNTVKELKSPPTCDSRAVQAAVSRCEVPAESSSTPQTSQDLNRVTEVECFISILKVRTPLRHNESPPVTPLTTSHCFRHIAVPATVPSIIHAITNPMTTI